MKLARIRLGDGSVAAAVVTADGFHPVGDASLSDTIRLLRERPVTTGAALRTDEVTLLCPVDDPPSVRDFMAFEAHVVNSRIGSGQMVPEAWYAAPVFYFTNPACLFGTDTAIAAPKGCRALDFELEVAALVADEARDLDPEDPASCDVLAGFMLMNDWSARDVQMKEMGGGLGPAKGKDFATSLGPWIVTPDELAAATPGRFTCPLEVTVNGLRKGVGDLDDAYFSWSQILGRASADTRLRPGDVIGSGTVGTGCLLELRARDGKDGHPWLRSGDCVVLTGGPLGTLQSTIA